MSQADIVLSRLEKVRRTAPDKWAARCPAHDDKGPSLAIRELSDGRLLLHCFAGCSVPEIVTAVGLQLSDLFPPKVQDPTQPMKGGRRPWIPADAFEAARLEVGIAAVIASDMIRRRDVSTADFERLIVASGRLNKIAEVAYGTRG